MLLILINDTCGESSKRNTNQTGVKMDPKPAVLCLLIGIIIALSHPIGENSTKMNHKFNGRGWQHGAVAFWWSLITATKTWCSLVSLPFESTRRHRVFFLRISGHYPDVPGHFNSHLKPNLRGETFDQFWRRDVLRNPTKKRSLT
jgi:hypothetical protein